MAVINSHRQDAENFIEFPWKSSVIYVLIVFSESYVHGLYIYRLYTYIYNPHQVILWDFYLSNIRESNINREIKQNHFVDLKQMVVFVFVLSVFYSVTITEIKDFTSNKKKKTKKTTRNMEYLENSYRNKS